MRKIILYFILEKMLVAIKKIFHYLIETIILWMIIISSFLITTYLLDKYWIVSWYFNNIKNFILDYNVFIIKEKNLEILKDNWDKIILWFNKKPTKSQMNLTWLNIKRININKDLANIRYIDVKNKSFPIIDVIRYVSNNLNIQNIQEAIDKLIKYGVLMKYKNIILTHSSWRWIIWKYWILNFKKGSTVNFEDLVWNKIKYKVEKIFIVPKKQYKEDFTFYKDRIYLVTCYPIWTSRERWIAVLKKVLTK